MIKVSKEKWDSIYRDYKGIWEEWHLEYDKTIPKEFLGKRTAMGGCISDEQGVLLTEGIHFEIVE